MKGKLLAVPVKDTVPDDRFADAGSRGAQEKGAGKEFNKYYTVKKGDTLIALAKRFNISTRFLTAWNNLKGKIALRPGKRIIIAKFVEKEGTMTPVAGGKG